MHLNTPSWWYGKARLWPVLLAPAALIWDAATRLRWAVTRPYRPEVPVICIGNLTAGGAGKTPTAIAIAHLLQDAGEQPVFLTSGFGGQFSGPHLVDREQDGADDVGDEALLLARIAPTVVAADRAAGARLAIDQNASVIVMDDGFQNPGLAKTLSLLVVDRSAGIGNGWVIPSGPLRAGLAFQLCRAHGLVLVGEGTAADRIVAQAERASLPKLEAELQPHKDLEWLRGKSVVAFAGIGNPDKFFRTLEALGCELAEQISYPDHYAFTSDDAERLLRSARKHDAQLVTTEKDQVRLFGSASLERLRSVTRALPVRLRFKDRGRVKRVVARAIKSR